MTGRHFSESNLDNREVATSDSVVDAFGELAEVVFGELDGGDESEESIEVPTPLV